jgi:putative chitobiose transport system substrate-binding protein
MKGVVMKKLLFIPLSILLIGILAGCADKTGTSTQSGITLEFWSNNLLPTFQDYLQGLVDTYQAENPHITLNWQDIPQDALQNKLVTAIAGNTAPDVVDVGATIFGIMASKGALTNLDREATPEQIGQYVDGILASDRVGGVLYGFPWYATPYVTLYNSELIERAGIEIPRTYDDLFTNFKTVKDKTGAYLVYPTKVSHILFFNDIPLLNADSTAAAFNTPEAAALLQKFQDGVNAGYIPGTDWNGWDANLVQYANSNLVTLISSANSIRRIQNEAPNIYQLTKLAPPLVGSNGYANSQVESLAIPAASKYHAEAIKLAAWIASAKNQIEFCKLVSIFPTTKEGVTDPFFTSDTSTLEGKANAMMSESLNVSMQVALPINQSSAVLREIDGLFGLIFADGMPIRDALNLTEQTVNDMLLDEPK